MMAMVQRWSEVVPVWREVVRTTVLGRRSLRKNSTNDFKNCLPPRSRDARQVESNL